MSTEARARFINLSGQVALVTGAGAGLGRAYALVLAKAGARVALTGRTAAALSETAGLIERDGRQALAVPGDVSDSDAIVRVVRTVQSQLGAVDILVNNAGVPGPLGYDWEIDPDAWWRTFEVNMRGAFRCAREVLPGMVARKRGRIVNVSSAVGYSRFPQMSAYAAAKAALNQWTKVLAEDLRPHGITVFAFHPGVVRTSMAEVVSGSDAPKEVSERFRAIFSDGQDTPIERSAELLLFLASGGADVMSGRFFRVQDDEEDLVRRSDEIQRNDLHTVGLRM